MLKFESIAVHPCVVDSKATIVYPRGLENSKPRVFERLKTYFSQRGYALKEDQRTGKNVHFYKGNRRKIAKVLLFSASILFESGSFADTQINLAQPVVFQSQEVELKLMPNPKLDEQIQRISGESRAYSQKQAASSTTVMFIFEQLFSHYQAKPTDPDYIVDDLHKIALYYSEFSEVVSMLEALKDKPWQLSYQADEWSTTAKGNVFEVERAVINFNTRSAAKLRLNRGCDDNPVCIASPADALLHELLHTFSMLLKTDEFIAQGGMSSMLYPYKHEYSVIASERKLYASMSLKDDHKRPSRYEHAGRMVKAGCPTCIN